MRQQQHDTAAMIREGLQASPKYLEPYLFYDQRGSELFEQICGVDEYYVTRTERAILEANAGPITDGWTAETTVFELGSGSSEKSEVLLARGTKRLGHLRYVPNDISESALRGAAERLTDRLPGLEVRALVAEFDAAVDAITSRFEAPRYGVFLGGNIGNFDASGAHDFLARVRETLDPSDRFLCGFDLVKSLDVLLPAYDDAAGVTAAFNLNALVRMNREYGASFDLGRFRHRAIWNPELSRVEMHLESLTDQVVSIPGLELRVNLARGETIHTENSHKYTPERIDALARSSGFEVNRRFVDDEQLFTLCELRPTSNER
jgi:dimethylhistidine N-methyltransferase